MTQLEKDIQKYLTKNCTVPKETFEKEARALLRLVKKHGYSMIRLKVKERRK